MRHFAARHDQRTPPPHNVSPPAFACEGTHRHLLVCPGLGKLRSHFRICPEHEIVAGPDVQLAKFLIAMTQYPLHPSSRVTGDAAVEPGESAPSVDCVGSPLISFPSSSFVSSHSLSRREVAERGHRRDEADNVLPPRLHTVQ
jgi:hypothetical protein